jgi:hypothetical protein
MSAPRKDLSRHHLRIALPTIRSGASFDNPIRRTHAKRMSGKVDLLGISQLGAFDYDLGFEDIKDRVNNLIELDLAFRGKSGR